MIETVVMQFTCWKTGIFFARPAEGGTVIGLIPGLFAVFYPDDAHTPGLYADDVSEPVRKVVIKIRCAVLMDHRLVPKQHGALTR